MRQCVIRWRLYKMATLRLWVLANFWKAAASTQIVRQAVSLQLSSLNVIAAPIQQTLSRLSNLRLDCIAAHSKVAWPRPSLIFYRSHSLGLSFAPVQGQALWNELGTCSGASLANLITFRAVPVDGHSPSATAPLTPSSWPTEEETKCFH